MRKEQLHNSQVKYNVAYLLLCLFLCHCGRKVIKQEKQIVESRDSENSSGRYRIELLQLEKGDELVRQFQYIKKLKEEKIFIKIGKAEVLFSGKILEAFTESRLMIYYDEHRNFVVEDVEEDVVTACLGRSPTGFYYANSFELKPLIL